MAEGTVSRPRPAVRIVGGLILGAIGYLLAGTLAYFAALALLQQGIATELPWVNAVQRNLYHGGLRAIWQNQPDCVAFDEELVYRAKEGRCRFRNAEFDTTLTFAGRTRVHGGSPGSAPAGSPGVAVIGDSFAMGWGVNDDETFAAVLQATLGRPVFNLGVSSYGTARELIALERSGLLAAVDTVVIQYCDNDKDENLEFRPGTREANAATFAQVTRRAAPTLRDQLPFLYAGLRYALKVPFAAVKERWRGPRTFDFGPHYAPLVERLRQHPALAGKRVIVFYLTGHGTRFRNFPSGADRQLPNVRFADLEVGREHFYSLDDHLTPAGHRYVAGKLATLVGR